MTKMCIIGRMYRLRKVIKFVNDYNAESIDKLVLEFELFSCTSLYENWFVTLCVRPIKIPLGAIYKNPKTEWGQKYEKWRHKKLRDLIEKGIELNYLAPPEHTTRKLSVTRKGRDFLSFHYFIEYTAREFGYTASTVSAFSIGLLLAYLARILG